MNYCKKTSFIDEKTALDYIKKLSKTSKNKNKDFFPTSCYLCSKCLNWHLTKSVHEDFILNNLKKKLKNLKLELHKKQETINSLKKRIKNNNE